MTCLFLTGVAFDPHTKINNAVAKVIGYLVFGKCFDKSSTDFQTLLDLTAESVSLVHTPLAQVLYSTVISVIGIKSIPNTHKEIYQSFHNTSL